MPMTADPVSARSTATVSELMLGTGVALMLIWCLSIADPCLLGLLMGDPTANPIAITECHPGITRGDVIIRIAALLLLAGLFACVWQLIQPERRKLNVAAHVVAGLTIALAIQLALTTLSPWTLPNLVGFFVVVWIVTSIAAFLAALVGSAIANTTKQ